MSTKRLYQVYDLIAEMALGPIIKEGKDAPAIRTFNTVLADTNTQLGQRPQDYELRYVGTIDDTTAQLTPVTPQTIATGSAWLEAQTPKEK